jgi:hypothetical protein
MKSYLLLAIILVVFYSGGLTAQNTLENDEYKYWQPGIKMVPQDFKADTSKAFNNLNRKYGIQAYALCNLESILDVPKKKRERGIKLEKVYLAPCILKYQSVSITTDSFEMAKQQMLLDITELFARKARYEFKNLQDSLGHSYGVYWSLYSTVMGDICTQKNEMIDAYIQEVILNNREGAYELRRKQVDKWLNELNDYATKPEDCMRFLNQKPLTDDYIMSPNYLGEIKCAN